mgnify:FL=1|jgi:hypothetical protein|tara:strand:- start:2322 stop:2522 length:201 start_codon:yes stop_codon:yes gene_type:complete
MMNKYFIKIVPFNAVEHDLQRYPSIDKVGFTVGYLVYQNNQLIKSAWFKSRKNLFRALDKFLNNPQ